MAWVVRKAVENYLAANGALSSWSAFGNSSDRTAPNRGDVK